MNAKKLQYFKDQMKMGMETMESFGTEATAEFFYGFSKEMLDVFEAMDFYPANRSDREQNLEKHIRLLKNEFKDLSRDRDFWRGEYTSLADKHCELTLRMTGETKKLENLVTRNHSLESVNDSLRSQIHMLQIAAVPAAIPTPESPPLKRRASIPYTQYCDDCGKKASKCIC